MPGAGFIGARPGNPRRRGGHGVAFSITLSGLQNGAAEEGAVLGFSLIGAGSPEAIRWQMSPDMVIWSDIPGATAPTETIQIAAGRHVDAGYVRVGVTVAGVERFSNFGPTQYAAPLVSGGLPQQDLLTGQGPSGLDASTAFTGDSMSFAISALDGATIAPTTGIITFDTDILAVQSGTILTVTASNSGGQASVNVTLNVADPIVYLAEISGLTDNPIHGMVAQIGTVIVGTIPNLQGGETVQHRWQDGSGLIAGATADQFTPVAAQDLGSLQYAPLVDGTPVVSDPAVIRHQAPIAGTLTPVVEVEGNGTPTVNLTTGFVGDGLIFSESVNWADVTGNILTIDDAERDDVVTITATNSGGQATVDLSVTITPVTAGFSVEEIGEEPVITAASGNVTITINAGVYAGTYTTDYQGNVLSVASIVAAPRCLLRPVITGDVGEGDTLTVTPGLWVYDGPDLGDQTWVQKLDGSANGQTDLSYLIASGDDGKVFEVDETYGTDTVTSDPMLISFSGAATAPSAMGSPTVAIDSDTELTVTLAADPGDGGSPITSYDLRFSTAVSGWTEQSNVTSPLVLSGLSAETEYLIETRAVNAIGAGPWSAQASATTNPAPSFAPSDLASLVAWYDFTDTNALYTDAARTANVTTDGDLVRGVLDKSGNGWHIANGSGGNTWNEAQGQLQVGGPDSTARYTTDVVPTGLPTSLEIHVGLKTSDTQFVFFHATVTVYFGVVDSNTIGADQGVGDPAYSSNAVDIGGDRIGLRDGWATGVGLVAGMRQINSSSIAGNNWKFFSYASGFAYQGDVTHIVVTGPLSGSERAELHTYLQARMPS